MNGASKQSTIRLIHSRLDACLISSGPQSIDVTSSSRSTPSHVPWSGCNPSLPFVCERLAMQLQQLRQHQSSAGLMSCYCLAGDDPLSRTMIFFLDKSPSGWLACIVPISLGSRAPPMVEDVLGVLINPLLQFHWANLKSSLFWLLHNEIHAPAFDQLGIRYLWSKLQHNGPCR